MTLQLLDFCLSILTLCSSYMEVPTYLNFKSMNHMVSPGPGPAPIAGCVALSTLLPLSVPQGLGWAGPLRSGAWEEGSFMSDLLRASAREEPRKGGRQVRHREAARQTCGFRSSPAPSPREPCSVNCTTEIIRSFDYCLTNPPQT